MRERSTPPVMERPFKRPPWTEIKERAKGRLDVAEHEFTHIVAIWGVGKSVAWASVEPTSDYEGVTIPGGNMGAVDMQIAAMASADHSGNGSDQIKAAMLQNFGGTSMGQAEGMAKSIINSYKKDVLHIAAMYLAAEGSATDTQLRQFVRWAEEEVKEQEEFKRWPIPSWSDELDEKQREAEQSQVAQPDLIDGPTITYFKNGTEPYKRADGSEETFCTYCRQIDQHKEGCPNFTQESSWGKLYPIYQAEPLKNLN